MTPDLTFDRLAQLCLTLANSSESSDPNLESIDAALGLDSWTRSSVLEAATARGFVKEVSPGTWKLCPRGKALAKDMQEAVVVAQKKVASLSVRSFTTYTPRGDEELG